MDWLFLAILVPAILIPTVLLFGFCGCSSFSSDDSAPSVLPAPPTSLTAVLAFSKDGVVLTWMSNDADAVGTQIERGDLSAPPGTLPALFDNPTSAAIFVDKLTLGLSAGTTYRYHVRSRRSDGSLTDASNESKCTIPPAPPFDLVATGVGLDQIDLKWKHGPPQANRFRVMHRSAGGVFVQIAIVNGLTHSHNGLADASTHEYQVSAIVDGFDNSLPKEVESTFSATAVGKSLAWRTSYSQPLNPGNPLTFAGACVVQRIGSAQLTQAGEFVRVTFRALQNAATRFSAATISNAVPVGAAQGWDSATPPLNLTFAGAPTVQIQAGQAVTSDKVKLKITAGSGPDLAIAMNIAVASQNVRGAGVAGARYYAKGATAEATVQDRSAGYNTTANQVCCVEKIEVG